MYTDAQWELQRDELESKQAQLTSQLQALMADVARIEDAIFSELGGNLKEIRALERREAEEGSKVRVFALVVLTSLEFK